MQCANAYSSLTRRRRYRVKLGIARVREQNDAKAILTGLCSVYILTECYLHSAQSPHCQSPRGVLRGRSDSARLPRRYETLKTGMPPCWGRTIRRSLKPGGGAPRAVGSRAGTGRRAGPVRAGSYKRSRPRAGGVLRSPCGAGRCTSGCSRRVTPRPCACLRTWHGGRPRSPQGWPWCGSDGRAGRTRG